MKTLHIYLKKQFLLPMYITQNCAMEWSLAHMDASQIHWLSRHNWNIRFVKPLVYNLLSDSLYNFRFSVAVEPKSERDLDYARLLFSDSYLEIIE